MKNFKKLLIALFMFSIVSGILFAQANQYTPDPNAQYGYGVPLSSIPQNAQSFIRQHFPNIEVTYIERDWDDIEVYLANGTQIEFFPNGDWKEVKTYMNMPDSILPANVMATVKRTYPQAAIIKIEKQYTIFEVKLNNMMELYIDGSGNLIGQKFDD